MTKHSLPDIIENKFAQLGHQNDVTVWELGWITDDQYTEAMLALDALLKGGEDETE